MKALLPLATTVTLAGALAAQQQLVLPDFQYLCESTTQVGQTGSTSWWRSTTGSRFQILYEASHFTGKAGIVPPITIDKLMFRGESGEPNLGGQSWAGVTVTAYVTSLSAAGGSPGAALTNTFATNLAPGGGDATLFLATYTFAVVTVDPSVGSTPNNYNIVLDLPTVGVPFSYTPGGLLPNLLIDITLPAAPTLPPTSGNVMAIEDTTGAASLVRGRGVSSNNPLALTGSLLNPPVVGIEFGPSSSGGWAPPVPARNEFYGAACGGGPSSFYQAFLNGQDFDLAGSKLVLTPDVGPPLRPTRYYVNTVPGGGAITYIAAAPVVSIIDDGLSTFTLPNNGGTPWAFRYPGGPLGGTTTIVPCTNGFIWLDPTPPVTADASPSVTELLTQNARLAPFWYDFDPSKNVATLPSSGMCVSATAFPVGFRKCYVTWFNVGVYNSVAQGTVQVVHDMQCVLDEATGVVEFHYGPGTLMPQFCSNITTTQGTYPGIVGFSAGNQYGFPIGDPRSRDLSVEYPFWTPLETGVNHMGLTALVTSGDPGGVSYGGRMFGGQTLSWVASDVPLGVTLGCLLLGLTPYRPGVSMGFVGFPDCLISVDPLVISLDVFPTPTQISGSLTIPHGWEGTDIYAQYLATDLWWPITATSNAIKHTVGLD